MSCGPNRGCDSVAASACRVANCALARTNGNTQLFRNLRTEVRNNTQVQSIPAPNAALGTNGPYDLTGVDPISIIGASRVLDMVTINLLFVNVTPISMSDIITLATLDLPFRPISAVPAFFINIVDSTGSGVLPPTVDIATDGTVTFTETGVVVYGAGSRFWISFSYPV